MKPAFIINNRNKGPWVHRCVAGALAQTIDCEIIIADFASTDNSREEIERAIKECSPGADHDVEFVKLDELTQSSMVAMNNGIEWMWRRSKGEWIFQCSSDDYSLPARVAVCMQAVEQHPCSAVATTQFFEEPGVEGRQVSGFPQESGYVKAGEGLRRLAYGSTIGAYHREFLEKVGGAGANTPDVYWGFLAALDKGFYAVANPQHVHCNVIDQNNVGFQGKLAAADGNEVELAKLNELNHFQLLRLYTELSDKVQVLWPQGIPQEDWSALCGMMLGQSYGWLKARINLHEKKIIPGTL